MIRKLALVGLLLVVALTASGSGLQASFGGSRLPNARSSMIFKYDGTVNAAGQLIDTSGANDLLCSEDYSGWTPTRATVTTNAYKNPLDGSLNVDVLREDGTAGNTHYLDALAYNSTLGNTYTYSGYVYKMNRRWVGLYRGAGIPYAWFDLQNGVVGTTSGVIDAKIQRIIGDWYRVWYTFVEPNGGASTVNVYVGEADNDRIFEGLTQDSLLLYGFQIVDNTDGYIVGPGLYHATSCTTTKPRLDLAPTGTPPSIDSHLQDSGGNKFKARSFDGATQYYSRAHHAAMDLLDTNHTLTFVYSEDVLGGGATENALLTLGTYTTDGIFCEVVGTVAQCHYSGGGTAVQARVLSTTNDSMYHVIQVVRNSNRAIMYYDGVPGLSVDVTGKGIDTATAMLLGAYNGGAVPFEGHILYFSMDNRALNHAEITSDLEQIRGVFGHRTVGADTSWLFTRSTSAKTSMATGGLRNVPTNVPRITDGVLIEAQRTNLQTYSEQIDQNPPWNPVRLSVTNTTVTTLPDGTTSSNDVIHEDGTAANSHAFSTSGFASTIGQKYTMSAYIKPINRRWVMLMNSLDPNVYVSFDTQRCLVGTIFGAATGKAEPDYNGFCRVSMTYTATGLANQLILYLEDADNSTVFNGLNQDSVFAWGWQIENSPFATSYCGPTGVGSLTCTADNMTMEPHVPTGSLLVVGDSISRDIASYIASVYYVTNTIDSGVGGNSLDDVRNRWDIDVLAYNPSTIYMHAGLGDILFFPYTLADMQADVTWIANACETAGIKLIVDNVGTAAAYTAPQEAQALAYNAWLATTFAAAHPTVTVLDFMTWAQNGSGDPKVCNAAWFDVPCVHPNGVGNPLWAALVYAGFPNILLRESLFLPKLFSPTGPASKVSFYGEFKCEWSGSTDIGTGRDLFSISGNAGTAHATRNQLQIDVDTNGRIYSRLYDDTGVSHYMRTPANPVNFGNWFSVRVAYDLSDFSRNDLWFSQIGNAESHAGLTYVGNAGTGSWDTTSDLVRIGQDNGGDVESFCKHRNVRVVPAYIPAP